MAETGEYTLTFKDVQLRGANIDNIELPTTYGSQSKTSGGGVALTAEEEGSRLTLVGENLNDGFTNIRFCLAEQHSWSDPGYEQLNDGLGGGAYSARDMALSGNIKISENKSRHGGGGVYAEKSFQMASGTVSGNETLGSGGGIYTAEPVTFDGADILVSGNKAHSNGGGGGIYSLGTVTMRNGVVSGNKAGSGGGIYADVSCHMAGGTVSGNEAGSGGGICVGYREPKYFDPEDETEEDETEEDEMFLMTGGTISGNKANIGGGVFVPGIAHQPYARAAVLVGGTIGGTEILGTEDTTPSTDPRVGNFGGFGGGGLCSHSGVVFDPASTMRVTFNSTYHYGGGIHGEHHVIIDGAETLISNNSSYQGGGASMGGGKQNLPNIFTMNNGVISGNIATNQYGEGRGGGVHVAGMGQCVFTMNGGRISGNKSDNGGGVYFQNHYASEEDRNTVRINGGTIGGTMLATEDNTPSNDPAIGNYAFNEGGGLYANNYKNDFVFSPNSTARITFNSGGVGGGIYALLHNGTLILDGAEALISNNEARFNAEDMYHSGGGGIFVYYGKMIMHNGVIRDNTTAGNGGGVDVTQIVYEADNVFTMNGGTVSGNTASDNGGGVYVSGYNMDNLFTMNGGRINGNKGCNGGGVYVETEGYGESGGSTVLLNGGTIGGTATLGTDQTTPSNEPEVGNYASNDGGGLHSLQNGIVFGSASTMRITFNSGDFGGGIYTEGSVTLDGATASVSKNAARTGDGGGIWIADRADLTVAPGVTLSGNTASKWHAILESDKAQHNASFPGRTPFTFSNDTYGYSSEYGFNNYDVNYTDSFTVTFIPDNTVDKPFHKGVPKDAPNPVAEPDAVMKPDYIHVGWCEDMHLNGPMWDFSWDVPDDMVLYAVWMVHLLELGEVDVVDALNVDDSAVVVGEYIASEDYKHLDNVDLVAYITLTDSAGNKRYFRGHVDSANNVILDWETDGNWNDLGNGPGLPDDLEDGRYKLEVDVWYADPNFVGNTYKVAEGSDYVDLFNNDPDRPGAARLLITAITVTPDIVNGGETVTIVVSGCVNYTRAYGLFGHGTEISKKLGASSDNAEVNTPRYARREAFSRDSSDFTTRMNGGVHTFTFKKPEADRFFFHARMIK